MTNDNMINAIRLETAKQSSPLASVCVCVCVSPWETPSFAETPPARSLPSASSPEWSSETPAAVADRQKDRATVSHHIWDIFTPFPNPKTPRSSVPVSPPWLHSLLSEPPRLKPWDRLEQAQPCCLVRLGGIFRRWELRGRAHSSPNQRLTHLCAER